MRRFLANNRIWLVKENQFTADEKAEQLKEAKSLVDSATAILSELTEEHDDYSDAVTSYNSAITAYSIIDKKHPAAPAGAVQLTDEQLEKHLSDDYEFDVTVGDFAQKVKTTEQQTALARSECTARIESEWDSTGQINASLGVYSDEEKSACAAWISSNRDALIELLARDDLLEIDVQDDQYWPVTQGSN